jgi:UPF0755 protein
VSRLLKVLIAIVGAGTVVTIALGIWVSTQIGGSNSGPKINLTIPEGASTTRIAAILDEKGIIKNATLFRYYTRIKGDGPFDAGDYTFRRGQSFGSVVTVFKKGPGITFQRLTVPEGLTLKDVAERVGKLPGRTAATFLEVAGNGTVRSEYQPATVTTLEGLLFPDTYFVDPKDDEATILRRMVSQFDKNAKAAGIESAKSKVGLSPYEAIVAASLVESEGKVAVDRPKIARVIYNRLEQGMRLQMDATALYACNCRRPGGRVLFEDLEIDSPYNTYKVKGLPPSPIAVSGRAALRAALNPEPGPWLYYVKFENDGTHKFATTLEEHNRNIADARRRGVR